MTIDLPPYSGVLGRNAAKQLASERDRAVELSNKAEQSLDTLAQSFSDALDKVTDVKTARERVRNVARPTRTGGAR